MSQQPRSPSALIWSGLGLVLLAFVVLVAARVAEVGAFVSLVLAVVLALGGLALVLAGAIGLGVRSGAR